MRREITFASLRSPLLGLLAAMIIASTGAQTSALARRNEYTNVDYAYAVSLPDKFQYEMNKAPNPNHGFRINVEPSALVWVDGSYTDDLTLREAAASERAMWKEKGCTRIITEAKELGGAKAVQFVMRCGAGAEGGGPTTVALLMTLASPPNRGRIRYEIGMQYPSRAASGVQARQVFKAVRMGFHFLHPLNEKTGGGGCPHLRVDADRRPGGPLIGRGRSRISNEPRGWPIHSRAFCE